MTHRIHTHIPRLPDELARRYLAVKFEIIPEFLPRSQIVDPAIKPLANRDWKLAGPAITVAQDRAGTFLPIAALGVVRPGDVILVAARGDNTSASWGGGLTRSARNLQVGGVVVDGQVLDSASILQRKVPVFCRGATVIHDGGDVPGSINVPTVFGGVLVYPGDFIVGDLDGLAVIPFAQVEEILIAAEEKATRIAAIGERMDREGVTLFDLRGGRAPTQALGIEWIDDPAP